MRVKVRRFQTRRFFDWFRAALFTCLIHGAILVLPFLGLLVEPEKIVAQGKPIQAVVVDQRKLEEIKAQKVKKLEELEAIRKEEEKKKAEEKQRLLEEQQKKKLEEEKRIKEEKRRKAILSNCEKLVLLEEQQGEVNHELDGLCEEEREVLRKQREAEEKRKREEAEKKHEEEQKERERVEEEKRQALEQQILEQQALEKERERLEKEKALKEAEERKKEETRKRKEEEARKRKEEENRKRKEAEKRKKEEENKRKLAEEKKRKEAEKRRAEQALQAKLAEERRIQLAAQTEREATNAMGAQAGRIKAAIENNWRNPNVGQRGLIATITIKVSRSGDVLSANVTRSSGDPLFDQSAEIAVKKASPLPIPTNPKYYEFINEFTITFNPDD